MYLRTGEKLVGSVSGNARPRARASNLRRWIGQSYPRLGQPTPAAPACIPMPGWIRPFKHFFSPKTLSSSTSKLEWKSTGSDDELLPDRLNPGYFYSKTHGIARDLDLDKKLKELMANLLARSGPFANEPFKTFVGNAGTIRIALVDLSTDYKMAFPGVAEFNSTQMTQAGSLAKIGLLYAAFQHRFDVNTQARMSPSPITAARLSELARIYDAIQDGRSRVMTFFFNAAFLAALDGICSNCQASKISRSLGLAYINSALWKSGLYDCRWGGIWFGAHYNEWDNKENKWECDKSPFFYKGICPAPGCFLDPKGGFNLAVNALSVATFFTLLAQGRLVDDYSSQSLKDILIKQPDPSSGCGSRFREGLKAAGRFATTDRIYSKIGVTDSLSHEGALIDRVSIGKKYVAVVLTLSRAGKAINSMVRQRLIEHLDKLIAANP